jgi:hypothetical protein
LNGELDNGSLLGSVTSVQRSSRGIVYAGKRPNTSRYNFAGLLNGIRVYSFALTKSQIEADMRGEIVHPDVIPKNADQPPCSPYSDPEDKEIPAAAAALGTFVAVACIGIWPSTGRLRVLGVSFAAGFLLLLVAPPNLPAFNIWALPLVTLGGAASVAVSVRPRC